MTTPVRIPADVDRRDRLVGPFTARQLAILALTGLALYLTWTVSRTWLTPPVFVACAVPLSTAVAVLVLTTRDGLSADRLLIAAIVHRLRPHRFVAAPHGLHRPPRWLTSGRTGKKAAGAQPLSRSSAHLPETVSSSGQIGVVDLGADGLAVVAAAGTVNLALRTPDEQEALVAQLGGWLHSLAQPVQILIRSTRLDLTGHLATLRAAAVDMSPELAATAHGHADHLGELAAEQDLLCRQVLLIWREPLTGLVAAPGLGAPSTAARFAWPRPGRTRRELSAAARRCAEARLLRRVNEATELLAPLGVTVTALDENQATAIVAGACNPGRLVPDSADTTAPGAIVTGRDSTYEDTDFDATAFDDSIDVEEANPGEPARPRRGRRRSRGRGVRGSVFGPESLTVGTRHLEVGADYVATLAVTGYPREVSAGWLSPLLTHPGRIDIAVHIAPIDAVTAAARLRRQLGRLESARRHDAGHGRLTDPQVEVAVEDAAELSARVARGEGRLFGVGLYLSVHADSETALAEEVSAVRTLAASLLIDTCHLTYRALAGWAACLPVGLDLVGLRRTFDTAALAAAFPFNSPQLPQTDPVALACPDGVLYGHDAAGGLLFWDRFGEQLHNHNAVVLGRSGAGKSYLAKLEILRSLQRGIEVIAIDPEDEYRRLADAVGGTHIGLGAPGVRLNPFDLEIHTCPDGRRTAPADALTRRKLFLHTVIRVLLGEQTPAQRAVLDTALTATYAAAEITEDPATWTRPAPTLGMLCEQLLACGTGVGDELAAALGPFTSGGAFAGLFDGPTTTTPEGGFIVFSLRELPEELKTIGTLLALDVTWRRVADPAARRPRLVNVDEAWLLMRQPAGAEFLFKAAKAFRKHWAGLTVATQDCADVLSTDLGKAIVANAATQVLLRQAPQAIAELAAAFGLSDGERQFLLAAGRGEGLLATGPHRAVFATLASASEHALITSDPSELTPTDDATVTVLDSPTGAPLSVLIDDNEDNGGECGLIDLGGS